MCIVKFYCSAIWHEAVKKRNDWTFEKNIRQQQQHKITKTKTKNWNNCVNALLLFIPMCQALCWHDLVCAPVYSYVCTYVYVLFILLLPLFAFCCEVNIIVQITWLLQLFVCFSNSFYLFCFCLIYKSVQHCVWATLLWVSADASAICKACTQAYAENIWYLKANVCVYVHVYACVFTLDYYHKHMMNVENIIPEKYGNLIAL